MKTKQIDFLNYIHSHEVKSYCTNNKNTTNGSIKVLLTKKIYKA